MITQFNICKSVLRSQKAKRNKNLLVKLFNKLISIFDSKNFVVTFSYIPYEFQRLKRRG